MEYSNPLDMEYSVHQIAKKKEKKKSEKVIPKTSSEISKIIQTIGWFALAQKLQDTDAQPQQVLLIWLPWIPKHFSYRIEKSIGNY